MHPTQAMRLSLPPRNVVFAQDFEHRKLLIDFQTSLHLQCEKTDFFVHQFDRYFDKDQRGSKSQRRYAKTAIPIRDDQWLIPDANVLLLPKDHEDFPVKQNSRVFLLEVARGKDVSRMYRQLLRHIDLMRTSNIQEALGFSLPYLVVFLVEDPIAIDGLKKRFLDDFQTTPWLDYFGFLQKNQLNHIFHNLHRADEKPLSLLRDKK